MNGRLNVYQGIQLIVFITFLIFFISSGVQILTVPEPPDNVTQLFAELKTLFLGLMAMETLKKAIEKQNTSEKGNEDDKKLAD